jgi:hypothetical protein
VKTARWKWGLLVAACLGLLGASFAAGECNEPERAQFDFWTGDWEVRTADGRVAGTSRIQRDFDGCVVRERYQAASGYRGESLNIYDVGRRLWRQTWVDNRGGVQVLEGGLRDGSMVLEGRSTAVDGSTARQRISWTPRPDGSLTQLWESSPAGDQWTVVFYGIYRRR